MSPTLQNPPEPIGWPLLPVPDRDGILEFPTLAVSVRQTLQVILTTRPGEQLMYPGFGAGLVGFIGEPDSLTIRRRIVDRITESIGRWEPRVALDRVDLSAPADAPGTLRIEIAYRLRRTGAAGSLGVNLKLNP